MHAIRLRGPWQIEPLTGSEPGVPLETTTPIEVTVPGDWSAALGANFRGSARYSRRFGLPTNLEPADRVSLVVEQVQGQATITLNSQLLGTQTSADGVRKYEVTQLLRPRNGLQIVVELPADQTGPGALGEVRLEIESS